ncbi:MAG: oligosaccharide flippase family protein [Patescibacteria group bacterium]|nr:oligosaccharide flippase family protein [Patescibacteria group bacterium]
MGTKRLVIFNTLAQLVAKAVNSVSTLLITLLITTNYGEAGFGNFNTIITYIFLFYILVDFGLNAIAIQDFVSEERKTDSYFSNLIGIRLTLSIFTSFTALAVLAFGNYSSEVKLGIIIALGMIFTQGLFNSTNAIFQARMRYELAAVADIVGSLTTLFLAYLVVRGGGGILPVVFIYVVGGFVRVGVSLFLARDFVRPLKLAFDFKIWKTLLLSSLPLGLTLVFSQIAANIDKQIIYLTHYPPQLNLTGDAAAGIYGLAYKFLDLALVLPAFFINSVYPIMIKKNNEGTGHFDRVIRKMGLFLFLISLVGAILGIYLAPWIISIFRGGHSDFNGSINVLQILLLGLPLFYVSGLLMWALITLGRQRELMFIYGFAALFNLVTNLVFIPIYGYLAAAVITLLSETVILLPCAYLYFREIRRAVGE